MSLVVKRSVNRLFRMRRTRQTNRVILPASATAELQNGPFRADASEWERIAARLHLATGSDDPEVFAAFLEVKIVEGRLPDHSDGWLTIDGTIRIRAGMSQRKRATAIAHELAHLLALWHSIECTHPDIWLFTIALLRPGPLFTRLLPANDDDDFAIILTSLALGD